MITGVNELEMPIELYQALQKQLQQAGVSSDLLSRGNQETPDGEMGLRLKGKAIDMVQVSLPVPVDVPPEVERFIGDVASVMPKGRKRSSGLDERMFNYFLKGYMFSMIFCVMIFFHGHILRPPLSGYLKDNALLSYDEVDENHHGKGIQSYRKEA